MAPTLASRSVAQAPAPTSLCSTRVIHRPASPCLPLRRSGHCRVLACSKQGPIEDQQGPIKGQQAALNFRSACLQNLKSQEAQTDFNVSDDQRRETVQKGVLPLSVLFTLASAGNANALEASDIVDALEKAETFAVKTWEFLVKVYEVGRATTEAVIKVSKPVVEAAAPIVQGAAKSALEAATPVVSDTTAKAVKFLEEKGLDLEPVVQATKAASEATSTVVSGASVVSDKAGKALQVASPAVGFLLSQPPPVLAAEAGALVLLYLATPFIWASIVFSFRGFAGELTPAQSLDNVMRGDLWIVDVRSEAEKEADGVPSLPRNFKKKLLTVPMEEIPESLRGQLKNARALEGELTAIKIASLKKLGKGSKVVILDSRGDVARIVARSLASLGYRNTFVVQDGMAGSSGWVNNQLAVDFYETPAELLTPSSLLSSTLGRSEKSGTTAEKDGTTSLRTMTPSFLALPSGRGETVEEA